MPAIACGLFACAVTVAVKWDSLMAFKRDKNLSAAETADSTTLRPILAYVAWQMFLDRPIMGCGLAHYEDEQRPYLHDRSTELVLSKARPYVQHNAVLSLLVETGMTGLAVFLLLIALWVREAWRLWRQTSAPIWQRQGGLVFLAMMAGYFPNSMFHDTTIIAMMNMLVFFWGGVVVNLATLPKERKQNDPATAKESRSYSYSQSSS
jgi:O-antigen ligase